MNPRDESDLIWFFCWSRGELEHSSNYDVAASCLELGFSMMGGNGLNPGIPDSKVEAATRERTIRKKINTMLSKGQVEEVRTLALMYGPIDTPLLPPWGKLTPLVPYTETARRAGADRAELWMVYQSWASRQGDPWSIEVTRRVRREAESILAQAADAYGGA